MNRALFRKVSCVAAVVVGLSATGASVPAYAGHTQTHRHGHGHGHGHGHQHARGHGRIVWSQFLDDIHAQRIVSATPHGKHFRVLSHPHEGEFDIDANISPDGSRVAYERDFADGSAALYVVDSRGRHTRTLDFGCVDPCLVDASPTWTPDGHHIVFTRVLGPVDESTGAAASAVLWIANAHGGNAHRFSEPGIDGIYEDGYAHFSPHRDYVIFERLNVELDAAAVFRMKPNATDVQQLTPWDLGADLPNISPARHGHTEDLVVFETYGHNTPEGVTQNIATVPATCTSVADCTSKIRYVTHLDPGDEANFNPTWSPNGKRIAYVDFIFIQSDNSITGDIVTARADGSHVRPVSVPSPLFDYRPDWQ
jgi:Tol biopolymer transport system component